MSGEDPVQGLLGNAGLGHYWDLFNELGIDATSFPLLTLQDLYSLGVDNVSDRKRMFQLIVDTRNKENAAPNEPPRDLAEVSKERERARQDKERRKEEESRRKKEEVAQRQREREEQRMMQRAATRADVPVHLRAPEPATAAAPAIAMPKVTVPKNERIRVCVRKRPINRREISKGEGDIVTVDRRSNTINVHEPKIKVDLQKFTEVHQFRFDVAFDENCSNQDIYQSTAAPLVESIFQGVNATCFAYGQTGSGKTHTMMGPPHEDSRSPNRGMIMLAASDIFERLASDGRGLALSCSFFEIYSGKLFDLLNDRRSLAAREDGKQNVVIVGLQEKEVNSSDELLALIDYGNTCRSTGQTGANADSSRSHAIIRMRLVGPQPKKGSKKRREEVGKFHFIDLAGSERGVDTASSNRQTRMEGAEINKSLLALKECIRAMDLESAHLPFRGSKLTQVLKDSFRGSSARTVMIANIGPNSGAAEHTLNTLRYSDRVKELKGESKGDKESQARAYALGGGKPGGYRGGGAHQAEAERAARRAEQRPAFDNKLYDPSKEAEDAAEMRVQALMAAEHAAEAASAQQQGHELPRTRSSDACHDSPTGPKIDPSAKQPLAASLSAHELLIDTILTKQDELVESHRQQIDDIMEMVKEEMEVLRMADAPGAEIDVYVSRLDAVLSRKVGVIQTLQAKLSDFRSHLQEEEHLNQSRSSLSFK